MDGIATGTQPRLLTQLPERLHHYAFVVRDQEINRKFFEDVLGIPLVATWCEQAFNKDLQRDVAYCHTFFGLADGGALAFFQFADPEMYERSKPVFPQVAAFQHIAFKVNNSSFKEIEARLQRAQVPVRIVDHGYCLSLYAMSPDGLRVEFVVDPPHVDEINAMRRADAHPELARWLAGDRRPNNHDRH